jgi:hypothetical protein
VEGSTLTPGSSQATPEDLARPRDAAGERLRQIGHRRGGVLHDLDLADLEQDLDPGSPAWRLGQRTSQAVGGDLGGAPVPCLTRGLAEPRHGQLIPVGEGASR